MVKIGLEIHGYLNTREKLFCDCKAIHGAKFTKPNANICPICTAQPGAKPMLTNKEAINKAIQISLILNCKVNQKFVWQRKHYDWPDLPKGFQSTISGTYAIPIGEKGKFLGIRITEAHLEEDPASWNPKTGEIDYNKSGYPLIEIVTEPDFTSSEKVIEWLKQLIETLKYMKVIDKSLGIKADVNISLPELGGERVEMKNINSLKNIKTAIEYEIQRQKKSGELPVIQETRMFDENKGVTIKMRTKEAAEDYRFISEPDLPLIKLEKSRIDKIKKSLPGTPYEKIEKLIKEYRIEKKYAEILTKKLEIVEFFEKVIKKSNPKLAVRWVTEELLSVLNYNKKELEDTNIKTEGFIGLLENIEDGKITELNAKDILRSWVKKTPARWKIQIKDVIKISDTFEIEKIIEKVIKENKKAVNDYHEGKKESLNFLLGQVMRHSKKRADFKTAREILENFLKKI
jgi:aspartyl-tRNA(Asn)/glutamyl-tRNA(Gln) amidotransferase subunit B